MKNRSIDLSQLSDEEKRHLLVNLLQQSQRQPEMSVTQERIWQLAQIAPGNPVYNFQSAIGLTGPLDLTALAEAANMIVARHETLRISYGIDKGKPKLTLVPKLSVTIDCIDLSAIDGEQQRSELQSLATKAAQTGFAIDQPLLFRLQCYRLADNSHVLVLTMHHIVSDLLSLDIFFAELGSYYGDMITGKKVLVLPPFWTYSDHSRVEHARRSRLQQSPAAEFWRTYLAAPPELSWRSDFPRPLAPTAQADTIYFSLDTNIVENVTELARREAVTPFVVLLSAYFVLQWALSTSDDQLVAVPISGRDRDESQDVIGMFSSPLPIRARLSGKQRFAELLTVVRQTVLSASEQSSMPFADIIELAQENGKNSAPPLRSMFSFVSRMKKLVFADLLIERIPTKRGVSDFDLFLTLCEDGGAWQTIFEYSTDLFSPDTAQNLADAYGRIVRTLTAQPQITVAELAAMVPLPSTVKIAVAATFTAELLGEAAEFWQQALRCPVEMIFAPYNQVFQAVLSRQSVLHCPDNTMNVLLIRPADWIRYGENSADGPDTLAEATGEFIEAAGRMSLSAPLLVCICPAGPGAADMAAIAAAEDRLESELGKRAGFTVVRAEKALAPYGLTEVFDGRADAIGHIPFTRPWYIALGTELVRRATSLARPPAKVIALDCDNTLWRGVCGEEGAEGVSVDEPFRFLQQFVADQAADGMLLCLVSKNAAEDVFRVFDRNTGMVLRRDQVIAQRINWQPKSLNLRELAGELQLGLDSFIFLDDNPLECAEVQAACPEVLTLCLPQEVTAIPTFLRNVWAFDRYQVSAEDRQRASTMSQNRQRSILRQQAGSLTDFIAGLHLQVEIRPVDDDSLGRLAQLSQRTNQFNNAAVRYSEATLRLDLAGDLQALKVSVEDRFGSYGFVGAITYRRVDSVLRVESFLLSCRVLGRGVEHRMLAELGRLAAEADLSVGIVCKETPRNLPFRQFLSRLEGGVYTDTLFRLSARRAQETTFDPEWCEEGSEEVAPPPTSTASTVQIARRSALAAIAGNPLSIDDILLQLDRQGRRLRTGSGSPPPRGETELSIAGIWKNVLRIDTPGRDDNFFEIGGNSLLLVQVNSRLIQHFGRDIEIVTLFQYPTIAALAHHLDDGGTLNEQRIQAVNRGEKSRLGLKKRMLRLETQLVEAADRSDNN